MARKKASRAARISRAEHARRAKISKSLKAYHKKEHARREKISLSLKAYHAKQRQARPVKGQIPLRTKARPAGVFGWDVQDQRPDVAALALDSGKDRITAAVRFGYTNPKTGEAYDIERVIEFEIGEDDDDFWENYHDALRDEYDDVIGDTDGNYESFTAAVMSFA